MSTMKITKKQAAVIAAIVLLGAFASAGVLLSGRATQGAATEHAGDANADHADHDEATRGAAPAVAKAHVDDHGHEAGASAAAAADGHGDGKKDADAVALSQESRTAASITTATAAASTVQTTVRFPGEIRFNEDRTAHVVPRLAGVVESVPANLGQTVKKGQLLAVIASTSLSEQRSDLLASQQRLQLARSTHDRERKLWEEKISAEQDYLQARSALQEAEIAVRNATAKLSALGATASSSSLNRFELRAPFDGTITAKHISLGEAVQETATVFIISDLSTVWAEFAVAAKDLAQVRVGERATVSSTAFVGEATGMVSYVGSLLGEQTRTAQGRVTLANPKLAWRPGLFVTVAVGSQPKPAAVAVGVEAVQTVEDQTVVFVETPTGFTTRRVTLGASDGRNVEVVNGLRPGERYAASNTFVLKSELGKGSAEHAH